jgi:hypothetical protein
MKYIAILLLVIFISKNLISQNRIVFNNNPYLVITNGAQLVIDNENSNAISLVGSGGNIVSENELNKVRWNMGTSVGMYTLPFSNQTGNKIPLSLDITNSGIANGSISFSTYGGATWDNSTYMPSDVTNMLSACCVNNSANVIDRFWIIDAVNYTTKPTVSITFTYLDAEHSSASNTITESLLFAQRFNPAPNNVWGDWLGTFGTTNTIANTVSSGSISPSDFFKSWTLVNQNSPLPIELLYFKANCGTPNTYEFNWATATENNNDYFTIEKSSDGINWATLSKLPSKGNSSSVQQYNSIADNINEHNESSSLLYFRLKQTDYDKKNTYSDIIYVECDIKSSNNVHEFPNPNTGNFTVDLNNFEQNSDPIELTITNVIGSLIEQRIIRITEQKHQEFFELNNQPHGVYYLSIKSSDKLIVKKIIHQ